MAGRLVIPKVILGSLLSVGVPCAVDCNRYLPDAHGACLQPSGATTNDAAGPETNQEPKQDPNQEPNQEPREKHRDDKGAGKKGDQAPSDKGPRGDRRGRGGRGGGNRFLFEAVRRDGGSLEFLPLLMHKPVREQMGTDEQFGTKLDSYLADMQKRLDEERKEAEANPSTDWPKLFKERLEKENSSFREFLQALPPEQMDRMVGLFVQYRGLRALSNRVIAIERLGMTSDAAAKLQSEINTIREETMRESNEEMRRLFTDGGPGGPDQSSFQQLVRKNQAKVDSRIEKIVDKATIDKLNALRGKPVPRELLDSLDAPPMRP